MYVELRNVYKSYDGFKASDDVSFSIQKGSLVGLLGPSGSGKTTILRIIAGLENPDSGDIIIDGNIVNGIPASKRGIGFVFQNYALFRYMTVEQNVGFGLTVQKKDRRFIKERVNELLSLVGLEGMGGRYPSQLSGGQKQRVAFARALAPSPQLLLLDEPFAAIDAKVRQELRSWLKEMIEQLKITSIFVTHDQDEAIEVADEIIITNMGRVEQVGDPLTIYQHPSTAFTASFIGQAVRINNIRAFKDFQDVEGSDGVLIRPEFVRILSKRDLEKIGCSAVEGTVEQSFFRGTHIELRIRVGEDLLLCRRPLNEPLIGVGERVLVTLYRVFACRGNEVFQLENPNIHKESVVI